MARVVDPETREIERREEWEWAEFQAEEEAKRRDHAYRLAKLKNNVPRHKEAMRVLLGIVKIPAMVILSIGIIALLLFNKEIPKSIDDFMAL